MTTRRSVLVGGLMLASGAGAAAGDPVVRCRAGRFVGVRNRDVAAFLGVRYGRTARFRAPVAELPARDPVRATTFGPVAPQRTGRGPQGEDCLVLNVWSPAARPGAKLPVMVYVHGGGYAFGSGSDPVTHGAALAARGVVVVTLNHRLNALGYLYLPDVFPDAGNAGQLDLVLALRWVRDNIAAFGGDPDRVTAFGDSGGGGKIATLMAMPAARGLFHRVVTMSGQQVTASGPLHARRRSQAFLTRLRTDAAGAAMLPVERLLEALDIEDPVAGGAIYTGPVLDRRILPRHPFWPDAPPQSHAIPMMTGNARDEMRAFYEPDGEFVRSTSWTNLAGRIAAELPVDVLPEAIVAEYRRRLPTASAADIFFAATTAGRSWRPQLEVAEARARAGVPVWLYQVDVASRADPRRGAFHCIDVPLLFGTTGAPGAGTGDTADVRRVSRAFQDHMLAFVRTGGAAWPRYTPGQRATMIVDTSFAVVDDPRGWQRELFGVAPYVQPGS